MIFRIISEYLESNFDNFHQEYNTDYNTEIALSSIVHQRDHDFEDKTRKLENLCKGKVMNFINFNNIDKFYLNRSKLHLNKSGACLLIKTVSKGLNSV